MRGDIPGSAWPPLFSARGASLAAAIQQFELTQWLPLPAIEAGQRRQLAQLASYYAQHSEAFRVRLASAGLSPAELASPDGLRALPPLTRRDLQSKERPVYVQEVPAGHRPLTELKTSGSTGEPVAVLRTAVSQLQWMALTMRYHLWAEPDFDGRICAIRANLKKFGEEPNWGPPLNFFFKTGPGLKLDLELDISEQIQQLRAFGPTSLVIYPSNLIGILDELATKGEQLPSIRRVRSIGEMLPQGLRERVRDQLGATLYDCYSSQEIGYIALQCPESELYHIMSETVLVEVVDAEGAAAAPGEAGRILVTDLHNHATPLIRYEVGDYAEAGPLCPCGRGLPTLKRILGRERNLIVKPDGTRHWPLTGFRLFRDAAPVVQYQMRQTALDRVELRLVVERPLEESEEAALRTIVQESLRYPYEVDFVYFEGRLPTGANGKFEEFLSLI
jgi:phenylacetate-CoA ligase